jgi:hypothetical protein
LPLGCRQLLLLLLLCLCEPLPLGCRQLLLLLLPHILQHCSSQRSKLHPPVTAHGCSWQLSITENN